MPATRPDLEFQDGKCDACHSALQKYGNSPDPIDWAARKVEIQRIVDDAKIHTSSPYDCIIPVAGGKDSLYQVHIAKHELGLNPLCLYFYPTLRTELGAENLETLSRMGVDMFQIKQNPLIYEKLVLEGFKRIGDMEWPNHNGIWSSPFRIAVAFDIPMILWGEGRSEYSGNFFINEKDKSQMDEDWTTDFGCLNGLRPDDIVDEKNGISRRDMAVYKFPTKESLSSVGGNIGVKGYFLGYYFKWDIREITDFIAREYGWKRHPGRQEHSYMGTKGLDCLSSNLSDYLKFCKYGYGRATDDACMDVRGGYIRRDEAVRLAERYDGLYPKLAINKFCAHFGMTEDEFNSICDKFTNPNIFETKDGKFVRDIDNSLVMKQSVSDSRRNPT